MSNSAFAEFVDLLLRDGCAVLRSAPQPAGDDVAGELLQRAHEAFALALAGPRVGFDRATAVAAARLVHWSCWFLVDHSQPVDVMEPLLQMPRLPTTPAEHVAADLTFRFLPQLHRRAEAVGAAEPLTLQLATILRQWPLSGVLSDVTEEPLTVVEFAGHPGLLWLYAERWAQRQKPAWLPAGPVVDYAEAVWSDLGKDPRLLPGLAHTSTSAAEGGRE